MFSFLLRAAAVSVGFFQPSRASMVYPTFTLNSVNGITGYELDGTGQSGNIVVNLGDINGDSKDDFGVGAPFAGAGGEVYVFFGADTSSPLVNFAALDGNNGFKFVAAPGENIGYSIGAGGDFNGDGLKDFAIGAYNQNKIYVFYGTRAGLNATFSLAALGANGFVVYGSSNQNMGVSITIADFNGDGFGDLIFGANFAGGGNKGAVYVAFGTNKTIANLNTTAFNGTNGFVIPGPFPSGQAGLSVTAGKMNGDSFADIAFGVPFASLQTSDARGSVVIAFGSNKTFGASLNVSAFNGTDGFIVWGVSPGDNLGSVVTMGKINNDSLVTLFIGTPFASPGGRIGAGSVFALFGKPVFNATVDLSQLNGTGYRANGFFANDALGSGIVVGDIDGDGFGDAVFAAQGASPNVPIAGSAFVAFGSDQNSVNMNPVLDLSPSNNKVLRINGGSSPSPFTNSFSVACANIRGDGYSAVIIGLSMLSPGNILNGGSTIVIYGDAQFALTSNQLNISAGGSQILTPNNLNTSVFRNPEYVQYTLTGVQHGQFEYTDQPGLAITRFSAEDIMMARVNFTHDDSELPPSYFVSAFHTLAGTTADPANVTFINQLPALVNNSLVINQGQQVKLGPSNLAAIDPDNAQHNAGIIFTISDVSNGFLSTFSFPQSQLWAGGVYFTQDNTINTPQYEISISRGGVTMGPTPAVVDFDTIPLLDQNHFDICQGEIKTVTSSMLSAIHPGANSLDTLIFSVNNVQYGYFEGANAPGVAILNFTQAEINGGSILFAHDGSANPPSFEATVSDGRITTSSKAVAVYFTYAPVFTSNALTLNQGQEVVFNGNILNAANPNLNDLSEDLVFTVSSVKGGAFIKVNTTQNITRFNQSQVTANEIAFESDGTPNAPSYSVVVANQCSQTQPSSANVDFYSTPLMGANQLTITGRQPVILTAADLSASSQKTPQGNLVFTASGVQNGCFDTTTLPGTCITVFPQQRLFNGELRFVPENNFLPAYNMSVSDGRSSSTSRPAVITLVPLPNTSSILAEPVNYTGAVVGSVVGLGALVLAALGISWWQKKKTNDQFKKILLQGASDSDQTFKQDVVYPIANKIFNAINTTGCLRQRTDADNNAYMIAITKIVTELQGKNANLDLNNGMKPGEKEAFLNEIARQTRQHSVPKRKSCSVGSCTRFFRAEATPDDIERAASTIAEAAVAWQRKRKRGSSAKNTSVIQLGVLSDFSEKAANGDEDTSGGPQLTWQRIQQEQKRQGEQLTIIDTRLTKVELGEGQASPKQRKSVTN